MQDSGYSDVIIGFNWTSNSQLSIHIDFTTLKSSDILPNPNSYSEPKFGIVGDYKSHQNEVILDNYLNRKVKIHFE